jgi:hypothetical protein
LAGTFNAHSWLPRCGRRVCLPFSAPLMEEVDGFIAQRLVFLGKAVCLNTAELWQLHQLGVEATNDMQSLKETCPLAFEGTPAAPSATQQQVGETLRHSWSCR